MVIVIEENSSLFKKDRVIAKSTLYRGALWRGTSVIGVQTQSLLKFFNLNIFNSFFVIYSRF